MSVLVQQESKAASGDDGLLPDVPVDSAGREITASEDIAGEESSAAAGQAVPPNTSEKQALLAVVCICAVAFALCCFGLLYSRVLKPTVDRRQAKAAFACPVGQGYSQCELWQDGRSVVSFVLGIAVFIVLLLQQEECILFDHNCQTAFNVHRHLTFHSSTSFCNGYDSRSRP